MATLRSRSTSRPAPRHDRRPHASRARAGASDPASVQPAEELARRAGGPEDRARYACACGNAFVAPVSTSVACPACGGGQDW